MIQGGKGQIQHMRIRNHCCAHHLNVNDKRMLRFLVVRYPFSVCTISIFFDEIPCVQPKRLSPVIMRTDRRGTNTDACIDMLSTGC